MIIMKLNLHICIIIYNIKLGKINIKSIILQLTVTTLLPSSNYHLELEIKGLSLVGELR